MYETRKACTHNILYKLDSYISINIYIYTRSTQLVFTGFLNHQQYYQQLLMIRLFKSYQLGWPKLLAAWRSDVFLMAISTVRALWLWTKRVWLRCLPQESSKSLLFCVGACFILRIFLHIHRVIGFWYAVLPLAFVWLCFLSTTSVGQIPSTNAFAGNLDSLWNFNWLSKDYITQIYKLSSLCNCPNLQQKHLHQRWSTSFIKNSHQKRPFLALMRSLIGHNLCCLSGRCPEGVGKRTSNCKYQRFNLNTLLLMEEILHQLIGSLSHYLHGFIHPRWLAGFLPSTVWF